MDRTEFCGCKGMRTCFICEEKYNLTPTVDSSRLKDLICVSYCSYCNLLWEGWNINECKNLPSHTGKSYNFDGIYIEHEFIDLKEEANLIENLDQIPWDVSQSGRRKQNFGPKCNFKKRRLSIGNFNGFPLCTKFVQDRFKQLSIMKDYHTIEQCSLEYNPKKGASIDPHVDDCWIWGERIVTLNLLTDSVLTLTPHNIKYKNQYNIEYIPNSQCTLLSGSKKKYPFDVIRIPMPRRSLLVLYGNTRYLWEHCVLREDIQDRRICVAYREFTPPYLKGGLYFKDSCDIIERAKIFW
ncbi:alpha-ketoglutarate-dependent dioxygenase alkB homolog 4 isoform X1 [Daktulosphaira vitifoliae]|uniref:alpha-ketoglutarate-dependent dioxygenase alkB homolog 4 isoform X1 n=1 Tax=Daktulosphaira vitifoliae TaxID=58002 RepID=UPI0021A9A7CE|nr:alpha-ketoglutarate-dependent dioxygenase alkB homolog 4 isoform X1 [Daktulosphaira vitifoliae]XP_050529235.1 alpha-ketoglutarate-dependent dioxygenase alkB homolog 4 isoform X1 [Daktulosphaira vitifoliae]